MNMINLKSKPSQLEQPWKKKIQSEMQSCESRLSNKNYEQLLSAKKEKIGKKFILFSSAKSMLDAIST